MGEIKLDAVVLGFTLGLSALTALLFGLFPALSATKLDLDQSLKEGTRSVSGSRRQQRLRGALVVVERGAGATFVGWLGFAAEELRQLAKLRSRVQSGPAADYEFEFAGQRL